jgi:carboxyl-terminal processing protease
VPLLNRRLLAGCVALIAACSGKPPAKRDSSHTTAPVAPDPGTPAVPAPDPREEALARIVLGLFETEHLLRKKIDDTVSRAAFDNYVERLDAGKMFLLAAHVDELTAHADLIDDELRSGSLDLAHAGARIFVNRVAVVEAMVAKLLASPFDHADEEWVEIDPEKLAFAATEADLRDRWRQRLELEVLGRVAQMEARLAPTPPDDDDADDDELAVPVAQIPTTPEARDAKARADLAKTYAARFVRLQDPGPLDAASDLVNAVSTTLDPHSDYLPPADKANFDIQMSGAVEGIGAQLREHDNLIEITDLVPGGAAWRQGELGKGDLILTVAADGKDPVDVFDMKIDDVVKMIRGPKGTVVHIKVRKPSGEERTVSVTRDVIVIEAAYARGAVLSPKGKAAFGYINLPSFYGGERRDPPLARARAAQGQRRHPRSPRQRRRHPR